MEASLAFADFGWVGVEVRLSVAAGWGILEVWRTSMVAGEVGEYEVGLEVDLCRTVRKYQVAIIKLKRQNKPILGLRCLQGFHNLFAYVCHKGRMG